MKKQLIMVWVVMNTLAWVSAQSTCPVIVQTALSAVAEACLETGRNQACYGNGQIDAQGRVDDFKFEAIGDISNVADIQSLALSPMDEAAGTWGVAYMNLQANLPDSLPGQGVTLLAFGDTQIENAVAPIVELTVTLTSNGRARKTPTTAEGDTNVLIALPSGTSLSAIGRNEGGDWLQVRLPEGANAALMGQENPTGWISTQVLTVTGDKMSLPIMADNAKPKNPMQAIALKTGVGDSECSELPPNGIVVQSPSGLATVNFTVNGVDISLGSTIFMRIIEHVMQIYVLEGRAVLTVGDVSQAVPEGTFGTVELDDTDTQPIANPTFPQSYDLTLLVNVPVGILGTDAPVQILPEAITIAQPIAPEELQTIVQEATIGQLPIPGTYRITTVQATAFVDTIQPVYGVFGCYAFGFQTEGDVVTRRIEDFSYFGNYLGEGKFGADETAHNEARKIPPLDAEPDGGAATYTVLSPTQYTLRNTVSSHYYGGNPTTGVADVEIQLSCEFIYDAVRIGD